MSGPERWLELGRLAELGMLSAELVHELRQPVFAIKATAQLMASRSREAPSEQLNTLLEQVVALETLLARYATTGRRPSGAPIPVQLSAAVEAGVSLLRSRAMQRGVSLEATLGPDEFPVLADPVAIQQVTCNLVQNALDAARSRVEVRAARGLLEVSDDGPGISDEVRGRLFEPFLTTKAPGKGTGLGLAVTRHLVESIGGSISWQSDGQGTRFVVSFRGGPIGGPDLGAEHEQP